MSDLYTDEAILAWQTAQCPANAEASVALQLLLSQPLVVGGLAVSLVDLQGPVVVFDRLLKHLGLIEAVAAVEVGRGQLWIDFERGRVVNDRTFELAFSLVCASTIGVDEGAIWLHLDGCGEVGDRIIEAFLFEEGQAAVVVGRERAGVELEGARECDDRRIQLPLAAVESCFIKKR